VRAGILINFKGDSCLRRNDILELKTGTSFPKKYEERIFLFGIPMTEQVERHSFEKRNLYEKQPSLCKFQ